MIISQAQGLLKIHFCLREIASEVIKSPWFRGLTGHKTNTLKGKKIPNHEMWVTIALTG